MGDVLKRPSRLISVVFGIAVVLTVLAGGSSTAWSGGLYPLGETSDVPRLSDKPVPYQVVPERPALPLELGCDFLGKGSLPKGIELPTGAV